MPPGRILVGTSSWADPGFVEDWYPHGMAARDRLAWYAERFEAVEVNSSFYAIPDEHTVRRWAEVTPPGFTFDYKLHRLLSRHSAALESLPPALRERARTTSRGRVILEPEIERAMVDETLAAVKPIEDAGKLGAFLLQLTPAFSPKDHRLEEIEGVLAALAPRPVAVELRHRGWVEGERAEATIDFLADRGAAFVGVDAPPGDHLTIMPPVDAVTNPRLAYMRAHGRNTDGYLTGRSVAERFGWEYSDEELEEIAGRARSLAEQADVVHVMFNNNRSANAPTSAREFRQKLGQDPGPIPAGGRNSPGGAEQLRLA
jgi:uncharacterized protein YecE (DUF72 family)